MMNLGPLIRTAVRSTEARVILSMTALVGAASLFALLTARWLGPSSRGSVVAFMTTSSLLMLVGSIGVSTGSRVFLNGCPLLSPDNYLKQAGVLSVDHVAISNSVGLFMLAKTGAMPTLWVGVIFMPFAAVQLFSYFQRVALHGLGRHGDPQHVSATTDLLWVASRRSCRGLSLAGPQVVLHSFRRYHFES